MENHSSQEHFIHQNKIRQIFFLVLLALLGALLVKEFMVFLPAFLGAVTLYILMRRPMIYLVETRKWSKNLSVWLLILLSFVVIMIPIGALIGMLTSKVTYALEHSNELLAAFQTLVAKLEERFGFELISQENISKVGNFAAQTIPQVLSATFGTLGTLFFMYFILYFMLHGGSKMEEDLYEYMPLKDANVNKLGTEIENMVLSNAIGIPVIALLQGVVALIGYLILGVNEPWFWFVITCITAMLPVVGAAMAYVPVSIILLANDHTWQGIAMLIFGFGVIGTVDNFFRFALAKKFADVHPLITVFGVIIGLTLFGFLGLIFGPLIISLFLLLLKMYSSEFFVKQREMPGTE
ncbi:MAG: AI-2E family transporter [Saprospiraceae bacterium]|nr:AI-2E family transporter [Candidatus Opimibacter skivensis]